jgi:NTP pyrophosphatase (non-canonical NTP hydrolase)
MAMSHDGLTKLIEECGELTQIAAKKIAYFDTDEHPDGKGSMKARMEEELADVMAACAFVMVQFNLDQTFIRERQLDKLEPVYNMAFTALSSTGSS